MSDPVILMVGLLLALFLSSGWAETAPEPTPLPDNVILGGTAYEVIPRTFMPRKMTSRLPSAYRFRKDQPVKGLDESLEHWLESQEFLRSPDGKYAFPFRGSAPFVGYIDLAKKEFIQLKEAFPPTGEEQGKGGSSRYRWTGVLDQRPEQSTALWLFVRRWDRDRMAFSSHRVKIPLADPGNIRIEIMMSAVVERVFTKAENEILCEVVDNRNRNWARISTETWGVLAKGQPSKSYGHLGRAVYSPDQREIYTVYSSGGLVIFNAENGSENAHHARVGHFFNAFTFGATFDPGGSVAAISTPYRHKITLIDVKTRQVLLEYKTAAPLAGFVFDEKELKAYAYKIFLPYE